MFGHDTATFAASGTATVIDLTGADSNLQALSFSSSDYTLGNGSLTLQSSTGTATVTVASNRQTIAGSMVLTLASPVDVVVAAGAELDINAGIGEVGGDESLQKDGGGTLVLGGTNSFDGGTQVDAGTLIVNNSAALDSGSNLTVGNASLFGLVASSGAVANVGPLPGSGSSAAVVPEPGTAAYSRLGRRCSQTRSANACHEDHHAGPRTGSAVRASGFFADLLHAAATCRALSMRLPDAEAERQAAVQAGVTDEQLAGGVYAVEDTLVASSPPRWQADESSTCIAPPARSGRRRRFSRPAPSESHVPPHPFLNAFDAEPPKHEPELHARNAGPTELPVAIVDHRARLRRLVPQVLGHDAQGVDQRPAVGHKEATAIEIREHPLVRIEAVAIGEFQAVVHGAELRADGAVPAMPHRRAARRRAGGRFADLAQRVEAQRRSGARRGADETGPAARRLSA